MRLPHSTFDHVYAVGYHRVVKSDIGPPIETIEIHTDLGGAGWSDTPAGRSLTYAVGKHMQNPGFDCRRVDIIPQGST